MEHFFSNDFISGIANLAMNDCVRNFGYSGYPPQQRCFRGRGRHHCSGGGKRPPHCGPQGGPAFMNEHPAFQSSWGFNPFSNAHPHAHPYFPRGECPNEGKCCLHSDKKEEKENSKPCKCDEKATESDQKCKKDEKEPTCQDSCGASANIDQRPINPIEGILEFIFQPYLLNGEKCDNPERNNGEKCDNPERNNGEKCDKSERNVEINVKDDKKQEKSEELPMNTNIPSEKPEESSKNTNKSSENPDESSTNTSNPSEKPINNIETNKGALEIPIKKVEDKIEKSEPWKMTFDLKNIDPKSVKVGVKDGTLRICGESKVSEVEDGWTSYETSSKVFERSIPEGVSENICVVLSVDGLLIVSENKQREVEIFVENQRESSEDRDEEAVEIGKNSGEENSSEDKTAGL